MTMANCERMLEATKNAEVVNENTVKYWEARIAYRQKRLGFQPTEVKKSGKKST